MEAAPEVIDHMICMRLTCEAGDMPPSCLVDSKLVDSLMLLGSGTHAREGVGQDGTRSVHRAQGTA
jgi:hypothetical protein